MISNILILGIVMSLMLLFLGSFILLKKHQERLTDTTAKELEKHIHQALKTAFSRILSANLQMITYTILLLFALSLIHHSGWTEKIAFIQPLYHYKPEYKQLLAFIIGGLMSMGIALAFYLKPHYLTALLYQTKGTLEKGLSSIFITAIAIGFIGGGLLLLGIFCCLYFLGTPYLVGFGVGTVFSAYFLRLGGGLFKTAADISSHIIENQEEEIPGFDSRNPLTILHLSSRFSSDLIGFSSDIISSFSLATIAIITLTTTVSQTLNQLNPEKILMFGFLIIIASSVAAVIGSICTLSRIKSNKTQNSLLEGLYACLITIASSSYIFANYLNITHLFWPVLMGIIGAIIVGYTSEVLTSSDYKTAKNIAKEAEYGSTHTFLNGFSAGLRSTPIFIGYSILLLGSAFYHSGLTGTCLAILGFLSPTIFILIMTAFKPLALTVEDINQLSIQNGIITHHATKMKTLSHTTAAIGNGYASGASIVSTIGLLSTLQKNVFAPSTQVDITLIIIFALGATVPTLSNSILLKKLTLSIKKLVQETLRQFKEIPYLYEHKARPDVIKATDIHAQNCMNALAIPASLLVIPPILIIGFLGKNTLIIYILGALLLCALQTFGFANTGDVLNHTKHIIAEGRYGGKKALPYAHAKVGDTIGDAFKDLLSPNMNILIKGLLIMATLLLNY